MSTAADTLLITLVQTSLHWEDRPANLRMLEEKLRAVTGRMEVVVLPEMFTTGFSMAPSRLAEDMQGESIQWMRRLAAELRIVLVGSIIIREEEKYFNRMIWMLPNGEMGHYDKRHLFAHGGEHDGFSAGNKRLIASVKGWKINLMVCYDLRFPVWSRQTVPEKESDSSTPEYDVLIYSANWPVMRNHAWKTLLQARAIENQAYVVGVNRVGNDGNGIYHSGDSMIVDPLGAVMHTCEDREEIFTLALTMKELSKVRTGLPFLKDADSFQIGL